MKLNSLRMVFAAALVGSVCSAQALTFSLTGWANGYQGQTLNGTAPTNPVTKNPAAGALVGSISNAPGLNANPFYTYCVELTQWSMNLPFSSSDYAIVDGVTYFGNTTIVDRLSRLFTHLGGVGMPANMTASAAIQLAVWEMIYEGNSGLNLTDGTFSANNSAATAATASMVNASASASQPRLYAISVLKSGTYQDFLLVQRIPEPASLALAGLALAGLVLTRRRRG